MLQLILNKFLAMDPALNKHLDALEGKNFAVICNDLPQHNLYGTFSGHKIFLSSNPAHTIDVEISGTLRNFVQFAVSKQPTGIKITGDALVAQLVQKLYLDMHIDWEEELAKITGDALAYSALQMLRQFKNNTREAGSSLAEMITEYLQEEVKVLPTQFEVENFLQEVDELRLRVDRLEARIKAYANS